MDCKVEVPIGKCSRKQKNSCLRSNHPRSSMKIASKVLVLGFGVENKKNSGTTKTKPKNEFRKMQMRISILLPSCNRSTDALLSQQKMLMESRRSVKMNTPTNRFNHRGVPRTKIERTTSLQLIHTYGVEDPAGSAIQSLAPPE